MTFKISIKNVTIRDNGIKMIICLGLIWKLSDEGTSIRVTKKMGYINITFEAQSIYFFFFLKFSYPALFLNCDLATPRPTLGH